MGMKEEIIKGDMRDSVRLLFFIVNPSGILKCHHAEGTTKSTHHISCFSRKCLLIIRSNPVI